MRKKALSLPTIFYRLWTDKSAFQICLVPQHFGFPPVVHDWVNKGLWYVQPRLCDWTYKDPVPFFEKSRATCPSGRPAPHFIHQVIIITGLNKLYDCMFSP